MPLEDVVDCETFLNSADLFATAGRGFGAALEVGPVVMEEPPSNWSATLGPPLTLSGSGRTLCALSPDLLGNACELSACVFGLLGEGLGLKDREGNELVAFGTDLTMEGLSATVLADRDAASCFSGCVVSLDDELEFGTLLLGPFARPFVMCVNSWALLTAPSLEERSVVWPSRCPLVRDDWSAESLGLALRDSKPASAGFSRAAILLFSETFGLMLAADKGSTASAAFPVSGSCGWIRLDSTTGLANVSGAAAAAVTTPL